MPKMIACCGLVCSDCPAFLATKYDDDAARATTAAVWAEKYGLDVKPEDVNCDGCRNEGGRRMAYCRTCGIRACCSGKGLDNCTLCEEGPCDQLTKFNEFSPEAGAAFEELKRVCG